MNTKNKKVFLKKYTNSELKTFANLSKDFNEIHFDNEFTNRSVYGKKIVYGVLILLDVLDKLNYSRMNCKIKNLSCDFISPIFINEKIFFLANYNKKKVNIKIFKNKNEICQNINLFTEEREITSSNYKKKNIKYKKIALKKNFYKKIQKVFGNHFVKSLINLSYLSGTIIPGNRSIILNLQFNTQSKIKYLKNIINFNIDNRFGLYQIVSKNNFKITSLKHPEFFKQAKLKDLKNKISHKTLTKKFLNKNCLVVGGSRGMGELFAKILYCLDTNCLITYNKSKESVKRLKQEINSKKVKFKKLDIYKNQLIEKKFDYIFYFATPKIELNKKEFDNKLFKKYKFFYNDFFFKIYQFYKKKNKFIKIFFPSTEFLNYNNIFFKEYCLAKKIAEKNTLAINKKNKFRNIYSYRVENLNTDQNLSLFNFKKNSISHTKSIKIANFILLKI